MMFVVSIILMGVFARSQDVPCYTLPTNFIPISYELNITTYLEGKFTFEGTVNISTRCMKDADTIVLNSVDLEIDTKGVAIYSYNDCKRIVPSAVTFDTVNELMFIKMHENLISGDVYDLFISFTGKLTDGLGGYYGVSYVEKKTCQTRWLALTQFEPISARSAFPCFDQPDMKANFNLNLIHINALSSYSNMQLLSTEEIPSMKGYVLDIYEKSPPMSTHLVAYVIADFASTETKCCDGRVVVRLIGRKDAEDQFEFAKTLGQKVLEFYEGYFDNKFKLSKLDMLAVPDFMTFGVDKWGLILFSEDGLLIDPAVASVVDLQNVAETVSHLIANQWLGDLVTLITWNDIWLQQGLPTFMGFLAEDSIYPERNILQYYTSRFMINVLKVDSLESSQPIATIIKDPNEIEELFDYFTSAKSALLFRGINLILGEETFKQGVRDFISKYQLSNAAADDFWGCLTDRAHKMGTLGPSMTVKFIMDNWLTLANYPVVTVERNYSTGQVKLSQKRFLSDQPTKSDKSTCICWNLPITWTTSSCSNFKVNRINDWLLCGKKDLTFNINKSEEWIILNLQFLAIYRVLYDKATWIALAKTLNNPNKLNTIHVLNRVQLVADSLSFAQISEVDYGMTFNLLNYFVHETAFESWIFVIDGIKPIDKFLRRTSRYGIFQSYMQWILSNMYYKYHDMNVYINDFHERHFKKVIVTEVCRQNNQECMNDALTMFNKWMETQDPGNNNILPLDMRSIIYQNAIKYGSHKHWDFLWNQYQQSDVESEIYEMVVALGCSSDPETLKKYLDLTIKENSGIRKQDANDAFNSVATNYYSNTDKGFLIAKDFVYQNVDQLYRYFDNSSQILAFYIGTIGTYLKTTEELKEFQDFLSKSSKYLNGIELVVNKIIDTINKNINWMSKNYPLIVTYMKCMDKIQ